MSWKTWALTHENNFSFLATPRMNFICSGRGETEYAEQFPCSAFGHIYSAAEQRGQWRVILEARRWLQAQYMVTHGLARSLNAALEALK